MSQRAGASALPLAAAALAAAWLCLLAPGASAQPPAEPPARPPAPVPQLLQPPATERSVMTLLDFRRRLAELDKLILLQNVRRAKSLLQELEGQPGRERDLLPRRISLARLEGDDAAAVALCRRALVLSPASPRYLREMAESQLALDDVAAADSTLRAFIAASPDLRSGTIVAVGIMQADDRQRLALAFCDSARGVLGDPLFMGRQRALCLLALDRPDEAADELSAALRANPVNLPLIRGEVLRAGLDDGLSGRLAKRLVRRASEDGAVPQERLLAVHVELGRGRAERATELARPLLDTRSGRLELLQTAALISREAPLLPAGTERTAQTAFLLDELFDLARSDVLESGLRRRALDLLAQACEDALTEGELGDDPQAAAARFDEMLQLVREGNAQSPHLYAAQILLAHFTRDRLGQPELAASRLERLLTDLDLPLEGVALARLTLGECYLAAGDTARGRLVLTRLGRSTDYRAAAGNAHFHLARLDLAEGHWETARDRFATVAMDNPMAPYANDALDLGLAIADEMENPVGGPENLKLYARAVYADLTAQPDSQIAALEAFIAAAAAAPPSDHPQYLLEKGRFELANLYRERGRIEDALAECNRIVKDHPDGRFPGQALLLAADILDDAGRTDEERATCERLLTQYPDFLFADDVRDRLRRLP